MGNCRYNWCDHKAYGDIFCEHHRAAWREYEECRRESSHTDNHDHPQYARLLDHIEELRQELHEHILVCTSAEVVERLRLLAADLGGNAMTK